MRCVQHSCTKSAPALFPAGSEIPARHRSGVRYVAFREVVLAHRANSLLDPCARSIILPISTIPARSFLKEPAGRIMGAFDQYSYFIRYRPRLGGIHAFSLILPCLSGLMAVRTCSKIPLSLNIFLQFLDSSQRHNAVGIEIYSFLLIAVLLSVYSTSVPQKIEPYCLFRPCERRNILITESCVGLRKADGGKGNSVSDEIKQIRKLMFTNLASFGVFHPVLVILGLNVRVDLLIGFAVSIIFVVIVSVLLLSCPTFGRSFEVVHLTTDKGPSQGSNRSFAEGLCFRADDLRSFGGAGFKGIPDRN